MRFEYHVSLTSDISMFYDVIPAVPNAHLYVDAITGIPIPAPGTIHVEPPLPLWWPPGAALMKHEFTETVLHKGWRIALDGHDCGPAIPHLPIPPQNALLPVILLTASREAKFCNSEVKANGKGLANTTLVVDLTIPTPMVICGTLPVPLAGTGTALMNTCINGVHWIDLLAGWADVVISMVVAFATSSSPKGFDPKSGGTMWTPLREHVEGQAEGEFNTGAIGQSWAGLIRLAGQEWAGFRGDADVPIPTIGGPVEVTPHVGRAGDTGEWTGGVQWRVGGESTGGNLHGQTDVSGGGRGNTAAHSDSTVGVGALGSTGDVQMHSNPNQATTGAYNAPFGSGSTEI